MLLHGVQESSCSEKNLILRSVKNQYLHSDRYSIDPGINRLCVLRIENDDRKKDRKVAYVLFRDPY